MVELSIRWKQFLLQWFFVTQAILRCSAQQRPRNNHLTDIQEREENESGRSFQNFTAVHEATTADVSIKYGGDLLLVSPDFTERKTVHLTKMKTTSASVETGNPVTSTLDKSYFPSPRFKSDKPTETARFTSQDISHCAAQNLQLNVTLGTSQLRYVQGGNISNLSNNVTYVCRISLEAPEDKIVLLRHRQFSTEDCWDRKNVRVSVFNDVDNEQFIVCPHTYNIATSLNHVMVEIKILNSSFPFEIEMDFRVTRLLQTIYTAPTQGSITLPWNEVMGVTAPYVRRSIQLAAPRRHAIMIGFVVKHIKDVVLCQINDVEIVNATGDVLATVCGASYPMTAVYPTENLTIRFSFTSGWAFHWFTLLFSFHELSALPEQLPGGAWNCSVPHWPHFRHHFRCNLVEECASGEDERNCSFSGHCGQGHGQLTVGDRCYTYVNIDSHSRLSWVDANQDCRKRGGYLASLNTVTEWNDIMRVLTLRRAPDVLFIGLRKPDITLPYMYSETMQWADKTIAYYTWHNQKYGKLCGCITSVLTPIELSITCGEPNHFNYLCEIEPEAEDVHQRNTLLKNSSTIFSSKTLSALAIPNVACREGHLTHVFLACDAKASCWMERYGVLDNKGIPSSTSCPAPLTSLPPSFKCASGSEHVAYSVVCDHRYDCTDSSDEDFCVFPPCTGNTPLLCSYSEEADLCDGQRQCSDESDETGCLQVKIPDDPSPSGGVITFVPADKVKSGVGYVITQTEYDINGAVTCPMTHFQCPGGDYCLPVYAICNGVYDCPGRRDEEACDSYTCPGLFRCHGSKVCLHQSHLCDGIFQCPRRDDELYCDLVCPQHCTCYGLALTCNEMFDVSAHPNLRYLDASGSRLSPQKLTNNHLLVFLALADCGLVSADNLTLPNLNSLDLSDNLIEFIDKEQLDGLPNLRVLFLAGNPLREEFFAGFSAVDVFSRLTSLDLSRTYLRYFNVRGLKPFTNLQILNLSNSNVDKVPDDGFQILVSLSVLDLRGCPFSVYPRGVFKGLTSLQEVYADSYKLCCPMVLPDGFNINNCKSQSDPVSSCGQLLKSTIFSALLSILAIMASFGNGGSLLIRVIVLNTWRRSGLDVFVTHLTLADLTMSVYLSVIGVADKTYQGTYLWEDTTWRHSATCQLAGCLSLLSNQVSSALVCLATVECLMSLRVTPFKVRFNVRSASLACAIVWGAWIVMAAMHVLPMTSGLWRVFSQSGLCMRIPASLSEYAGRDHVTAFISTLNLSLLSFIGVAQSVVYWNFTNYTVTIQDPVGTSESLCNARRLFLVSVSKVFCWFPLSLTGLLVSLGIPLAKEIRVAMAILMVPLNSALNPYLYALSVVLEKRRKEEKERLMKYLKASVLRTKNEKRTQD